MNIITKEEVINAQNTWGNAVVEVGRHVNDKLQSEIQTNKLLDTLYAFETETVLFKPTKASLIPFRLTTEGAISYFIGGNDSFPEDGGFALEPWTKVRFENADIIIKDSLAFALGHYYFTDVNNNEVKVEYTFGYIKNEKGQIKIFIHHSSLPYQT